MADRWASDYSDVLHPGRPNTSKDEIRDKLAELYKASKDQISVFGFRTQYGGGKSTGFGLIYDSTEALKKFEPRYRLIRIGQATKIERASRQQRTSHQYTRDDEKLDTVGTDGLTDFLQASNARTDRRHSVARQRSRVPSPRRRNRGWALDLFAGVWWIDVGFRALFVCWMEMPANVYSGCTA